MRARTLTFLEALVSGTSAVRSTTEEWCLLSWRILVGTFLVWGVWDNIVDPARMVEFGDFLSAYGFPYPQLLARLSVWTQLASGVCLALGLFTRLGGGLCGINFLVALVMVDAGRGFREAFPAAMLLFFGIYMAASGPGRFSVDALAGARFARLSGTDPLLPSSGDT